MTMVTLLNRYLSPRIGQRVRQLVYWPQDLTTLLSNPKRNPLIPPRWRDFVGGGDFAAVGDLYLRYFVELGQLRTRDQVLDVGCGLGRMAVPLTQYLDLNGTYWGFDVEPSGIYWCQTRIAKRYPQFHFTLAQVRNRMYNPRGHILPETYRFPYEDQKFEFQFATSVFTHMNISATLRYIEEIGRVLKPGGRSFNTFFLINAESLACIQHRRSSQAFRYQVHDSWTISKTTPEKAIGHSEASIRERYAQVGLRIIEPIHYGSWCGRDRYTSYQDMVVAVKE